MFFTMNNPLVYAIMMIVLPSFLIELEPYILDVTKTTDMASAVSVFCAYLFLTY